MMEKLKPVYVLALIAAIISGLIIVVYNLTYVDTTNILTEKQAIAVMTIYGGTKDDFEIVPLVIKNDNNENVPTELGQKLTDAGLDIAKVIRKKSDGSLAFECLVKGYKKGFDIMVGVKGGAVAGVAIVSVGEETPGLGTNTNDPEFLDNFKGISDKAVIVKTAPTAAGEVQAVTSATFSSKGVATAVNTALEAYDVAMLEYVTDAFNSRNGGEAQ